MENQKKSGKWSTLFRVALLLSLLPSPSAVLRACGDSTSPDTLSLFDHRILRNPLFIHFFDVHMYSECLCMPGPAVEYSDEAWMRREWEAFFKEIGLQASVQEIVFAAEAAPIDALIEKQTKARAAPAVLEALRYLRYMHEVAPFIEPRTDRWGDPVPVKVKMEDKDRLLSFALGKAEDKSCHSFLRQRYAFQAERLAVFWDESRRAIDICDRLILPSAKDGPIRYRALGYKARALFLTGNKAAALSIYLDIYDQYPPMLEVALRSINRLRLEDADIEACSRALKSSHKKATLYLVISLLQKRDYSVETLRKLLALEPGSDRPEALLIRMIHQIEVYNLEENFYRFFQKKPQGNRYNELIALCVETAAAPKKPPQPGLWLAAAAYLGLLEGDTQRAAALLDRLDQQPSQNQYLVKQVHLLRTLCLLQESVAASGGIDSKLKSRAVADLDWFGGFPPIDPSKDSGNQNGRITQSLLLLMASRSMAGGDPVTAAICYTSCGRGWRAHEIMESSVDDATLMKLQKLLSNIPPGSLEKKLIDNSNLFIFGESDIIFLRAMLKMRRGEYLSAIEILSALYPEGDPDAPATLPTLTFSEENVELTKQAPRKELDLRAFCRLLIAYQGQAATAEKKDPERAAQLHYRLGNIYYSLEHEVWDTQHTFIDLFPRHRDQPYYHIESEGENLDTMPGTGIGQEAVDRTDREMDNFLWAERHYAKALNLAADPELGARCCLMILACRNLFLYPKFDQDVKEVSFFNNSRTFTLPVDVKKDRKGYEYQYLLMGKYRSTRFVKEYLTTCPVLKMFE